MISICIPIYNFNVVDLVKKLSVQSDLLSFPSEIILIDDCSENTFKKINEAVCSEEIYIQLDKNIGRSAIRNLFLNYAKYDHLLFLDCDSIIPGDDFLSKYTDSIKEHPNQLICGGRVYPAIPPNKNELLRWTYGTKRESKTHTVRKQNPNRSFMTNNFVISKKIFESIRFDERLVEYGHEDTLFGFELKKRKIEILHIDNPTINGDLEDNANYISNTEKAVGNLTKILEFTNYDKDLIQDVSLLRTYYKLYKMRSLIKVTFIILKPSIKYLLSHAYANIYLFDFYKLGILSINMNSKK